MQRGLQHPELFDFVVKPFLVLKLHTEVYNLSFLKPTLLSLSSSPGSGERPRHGTRAVAVQRAGAADARGMRQQAARPWCVCWGVCVVWFGIGVVTRLIKPAAVVLPAAFSPGDGAGGGGFGSAGAGAGGVGGWVQGLCPRTGPGPSFTGAAGAGRHWRLLRPPLPRPIPGPANGARVCSLYFQSAMSISTAPTRPVYPDVRPRPRSFMSPIKSRAIYGVINGRLRVARGGGTGGVVGGAAPGSARVMGAITGAPGVFA